MITDSEKACGFWKIYAQVGSGTSLIYCEFILRPRPSSRVWGIWGTSATYTRETIKMIVQVNLNEDFTRNIFLPTLGFQPTTFQLMHPNFPPIDRFAPTGIQYSVGPRRGRENLCCRHLQRYPTPVRLIQ